MPEKGVFWAPLSGLILIACSAGRVEIVTFDDVRKVTFLGFCTEAIYLKACFVKSEIGLVTFCRK